MTTTLDSIAMPAMREVCPKCHSEYSYRGDESGNVIRELCKVCHVARNWGFAVTSPGPIAPFIAFTGLAQSGKTTCANHLRLTRRYRILSFAAPLKRMLATLVDIRDKDAMPEILCGQTVRHAMQTLGTEWGRQLIGDDIWLRAAREEAKDLRKGGAMGIACDDVRFSNEAKLVRELGGIVIWLGRPGLQAMGHVSESGIDPALVDHRITAETSESLIEQLDSILSRA